MASKSDDEDVEAVRRASGECLCSICGRFYQDHPMDQEILSGIDGRPFLHLLCNGALVQFYEKEGNTMSGEKKYGFFSLVSAKQGGTSVWRTVTGQEVEVSCVSHMKDGSDYLFRDKVALGEVTVWVRVGRDSSEFRRTLGLKYRFWVSNLNTDEGHYGGTTDELTALVDRLLESGLGVGDIGIGLENLEEGAG